MHACAAPFRRAFLVLAALALAAAAAVLVQVAPTSAVQARGVVRPLTEPTYRYLLYVSHIVAPDATGAEVSKVTAHAAPIATGGGFDATGAQSAFGAQVARMKLPEGVAVPRMPPLELGAQPEAGYAQDVLMRRANDWVASNATTTLARLGAWMRERQLSAGHYAYTREVTVASAAGPRPRVLYWVALVDGNGRALYGKPVLTDTDPIFLHVTYVSLAVADGLPAGWKFDEGGRLSWQLLNRQFEPQGSTVWRDVNGAFDGPADAEDPQAGVRCLVDERNPGCVDAGVSVRSLMADTGAAAALVDYVHAVEPKYAPVQTCQLADGTEADCEQAEAAFRYTERTWSCSGLTNRGFLGFRLAMRASRYLAAPGEPLTPFQLVTEQVREALSPTEPFDKFVARSALGGADPDSVLISPLPQELSLVSRADANFMKMVTDVSALQTISTDGGLTLAASHADLAVTQPSADTYVLSASNTVAPAGVITPERWATFYVSDPAAVDVLQLASLVHTGPIEISLNGHVVYIGPPELGGSALTLNFSLPSATVGWSDSSGYTASGAMCVGDGAQGAWCGPVVASDAGNICLVPACGEGGCYGCFYRAALAPWAHYSGSCTPFSIAVGEGSYEAMSCTTGPAATGGSLYDLGYNGSRWFSPSSYRGPYSAAPQADLKPWLVQGMNVLKIKAAPYAGWGYSVQLRSNSCLAQDAGVALPATLPVPVVSQPPYDPCAGGQCSGW